jgi:hypothetical protein
MKETIETPEIVGEIDLPPLDVDQFVGRKVKIASVTLKSGEFGWYYLVEAESVSKDADICPSKILGLKQDAEGKWGWPKQSKTALFLAKMNAGTPEELVGRTVTVTKRENKEGMEFLTF